MSTKAETFYFEEIKQYIKQNSYFEYEGYECGTATFATRRNGSVYDCSFSKKDLTEAVRLGKELSKIYKGKNVEISVDTCDEWVYVKVKTPREPRTKISYGYGHFDKVLKKGATSYLDLWDIENKAKKELGIPCAEFRRLVDELNKLPLKEKFGTTRVAEIKLGNIGDKEYTLEKISQIVE